jgi:glutamine synthetase
MSTLLKDIFIVMLFIKKDVDTLPVLKESYVEKLFYGLGAFLPVELGSRFEIYAEPYILTIEVEAKLVVSMAKTGIYPVATKYLTDLSLTLSRLKGTGRALGEEPLTCC